MRMPRRLTIKDAAEAVGVAPSTIRNWQRRGLIHVRRDWRSALIFTDADIERLRFLAGVSETDD